MFSSAARVFVVVVVVVVVIWLLFVLQTKSTYTMDLRNDFVGGLLPLWEDDPVNGTAIKCGEGGH